MVARFRRRTARCALVAALVVAGFVLPAVGSATHGSAETDFAVTAETAVPLEQVTAADRNETGAGIPTFGERDPTDPNDDGEYEDLSGNGVVDNQDVIIYFEQMEQATLTSNVASFDYSGNGQIDYRDLVILFGYIDDLATPDPTPTATPIQPPRDVIVVDHDGSADYERLSAGVDNADPGDVVRLRDGVYEGAVVDRTVTIEGSNASIDPREGRPALVLEANATVRNLAIVGGTHGVVVRDPARGATLANLRMDVRRNGVVAERGVRRLAATNVTVTNASAGFVFDSAGDWRLQNVTARDLSGEAVTLATHDGSLALSGFTTRDVERSVDTVWGSQSVSLTNATLSARSSAIDAESTDGDWRLDDVRIGNATDVGIAAADATGRWEITGSTLGGAEAAIRAGDANASRWTLRNSRIEGPVMPTSFRDDVRSEDVTWAVATNVTGYDLAVAADGSARYRSIQAAVDAAGPGDDVYVFPGTYAGNVTVDEPVTLVGPRASIARSPETSGSVTASEVNRSQTETSGGTAVTVRADATISGFDVEGFGRGISITDRADDVAIQNVGINDTDIAVDGAQTDATVTVSHLSVTEGRTAIAASGTSGEWTLSHLSVTDVRGTAVAGNDTAGDWRIADTRIENGSGPALAFNRARGDVFIVDFAVDGAARGLSFDGLERGSIVVNDATVAATTGPAVSGRSASSTVILTELAVERTAGDVLASDAATNWTIGRSSFERSALRASGSTANWTLSNVDFVGPSDTAVSLSGTRGYWDVENVSVIGNPLAFDARRAEGTLEARHLRFENVTTVLTTEGGDGAFDATVDGAAVRGGGPTAVAVGSGDRVAVTRSSFQRVDSPVVRAAPDGAVSVTDTWWGHPGGPTATQIEGNVTVSDSCSSPCGPAATGP